MYKNFKVKFINHACIQIFYGEFSILIDPWFDGKVFNNSWKLLKDTDLKNVDFTNLKYIVFSHEHPDHLNFDTLKKMKSFCSIFSNILSINPQTNGLNKIIATYKIFGNAIIILFEKAI